MFKLTCENCGYEDKLDKFIFTDQKVEKMRITTITIECPICGFHSHIEN